MANQFVRRKAAARPLGRRALKRRLAPSPKQSARIIAQLKADAARRVREGLDQRLADETPVKD